MRIWWAFSRGSSHCTPKLACIIATKIRLFIFCQQAEASQNKSRSFYWSLCCGHCALGWHREKQNRKTIKIVLFLLKIMSLRGFGNGNASQRDQNMDIKPLHPKTHTWNSVPGLVVCLSRFSFACCRVFRFCFTFIVSQKLFLAVNSHCSLALNQSPHSMYRFCMHVCLDVCVYVFVAVPFHPINER